MDTQNSGSCRCQVCGVVIGGGLTHCLRCRSLRATVSPRPAARPFGLLFILALAGVTAAGVWYARRDAPADADMTGDQGAGICEGAQCDPDEAQPVLIPADTPAFENQALMATQAGPAAARHERSALAAVARPEAQRPDQTVAKRQDTRPVKRTGVCRACGGTGRYRSGSADRTCPICKGTPNKVRWVSPTHALCTTCAGFGQVMETRNGTRRPTDCRGCRGCGLIRK